jgi:hypothetical protein
MDNKQTRIFYLVVLLFIILFYDFWLFFLKDKWQQNEVSVIEIKTCQVTQEIKPEPAPVEVVVEHVIVQAPKNIIVEEDLKVLSPEDVFWGNRGYTTKDGQLTYRPSI